MAELFFPLLVPARCVVALFPTARSGGLVGALPRAPESHRRARGTRARCDA